MFNSTTLEIVIGLVFVYLLFSLVCTTLAEAVARMLRLRSSTLKSSISNMLAGENGDTTLVKQFYAHPLIRSLAKTSWYDWLLAWPQEDKSNGTTLTSQQTSGSAPQSTVSTTGINWRKYLGSLRKWIDGNRQTVMAIGVIVVITGILLGIFGIYASVSTPLLLVLGSILLVVAIKFDQGRPSYIAPHDFALALLDITEQREVELSFDVSFDSTHYQEIITKLSAKPPELTQPLSQRLRIPPEDLHKLVIKDITSGWKVDYPDWHYTINCDARGRIKVSLGENMPFSDEAKLTAAIKSLKDNAARDELQKILDEATKNNNLAQFRQEADKWLGNQVNLSEQEQSEVITSLRNAPHGIGKPLFDKLGQPDGQPRVDMQKGQWSIDRPDGLWTYVIDCNANGPCQISLSTHPVLEKTLIPTKGINEPLGLKRTLQTLWTWANVEAQRKVQANVAQQQTTATLANQPNPQVTYQEKIEQWFKDVQDRVNGWYTRKISLIIFVLAFFVTFAFNLDTLAIVNTLSQEGQLRKTIVEQAEQSLTTNPQLSGATMPTDTVSITSALGDLDKEMKALGLPIGWVNIISPTSRIALTTALSTTVVTVTTVITSTSDNVPTTAFTVETAVTTTNRSTLAIAVSPSTTVTATEGVPLTNVFTVTSSYFVTTTDNAPTGTVITTNSWLGPLLLTEIEAGSKAEELAKLDRRLFPKTGAEWGEKIPGFLLTILALSLGAPFWFDTLGRLANLRSAGKSPESPEQP